MSSMTRFTLHARHALLADGWHADVRIEIADGAIASLAAGVTAGAGDERHEAVLPGLSNLHSHAFQRIMAGRTETRGPGADTFWSWRDLMYRTALALTPEDVEAIAAMAYVEMLEAGYVRVGEFHYLHHDCDGLPYGNVAEMAVRIAAAAGATGIGLTLLPVRYASGGFGGQPPTKAQRRFITTRDMYERLHDASRAAIAGLPDAVLGVAPHSLRAVTPEELSAAVACAKRGPIHIHVAEQTKEVDDCVAWSGQRPVAWLMAHEKVDQQWCLIHATHMTAQETTALASSGAIAGLCPLTEANLGDGLFPAAAYRTAGGRFGIGTDQNAEIGTAGELQLLEYGQRLALRARNVLAEPNGSTGRALFDAALAGGAQAVGQPTFGLAIGTVANLLTLKPNERDWPLPIHDALLDAWIFSRTINVDSVYVRGKRVVEGRRHIKRDAIASAYGRVLRKALSA
jgi:formimidoylglutamate deiminase